MYEVWWWGWGRAVPLSGFWRYASWHVWHLQVPFGLKFFFWALASVRVSENNAPNQKINLSRSPCEGSKGAYWGAADSCSSSLGSEDLLIILFNAECSTKFSFVMSSYRDCGVSLLYSSCLLLLLLLLLLPPPPPPPCRSRGWTEWSPSVSDRC